MTGQSTLERTPADVTALAGGAGAPAAVPAVIAAAGPAVPGGRP